MDLEAMSVQPSANGSLLAKLREYRPDLSNLKSAVNKLTMASSIQTSKEELLESGLADTLSVSADQRRMFVMPIERLNQSIERVVVDDRRTMLETDGPGALIYQNLTDGPGALIYQNFLDTYNMLYGGDGKCVTSQKSNEYLSVISKNAEHYKLHGCFTQLHGGDDNIRKSKKILSDKNKWIIISIILALVLATLLIIYFKLTS